MRAFYSLYAQLIKVGVTVEVAKRLEVWEAAAELGVGLVETQTGPSTAGVPNAEMDLLRQRVAHAAGEAPEPQRPAPNPADQAALMAQLLQQ